MKSLEDAISMMTSSHCSITHLWITVHLAAERLGNSLVPKADTTRSHAKRVVSPDFLEDLRKLHKDKLESRNLRYYSVKTPPRRMAYIQLHLPSSLHCRNILTQEHTKQSSEKACKRVI